MLPFNHTYDNFPLLHPSHWGRQSPSRTSQFEGLQRKPSQSSFYEGKTQQMPSPVAAGCSLPQKYPVLFQQEGGGRLCSASVQVWLSFQQLANATAHSSHINSPFQSVPQNKRLGLQLFFFPLFLFSFRAPVDSGKQEQISTTFLRWSDSPIPSKHLCEDVAPSLPGLRCRCALSSIQKKIYNKQRKGLETSLNGCFAIQKSKTCLSKYTVSLYWGKLIPPKAGF